MFRDII